MVVTVVTFILIAGGLALAILHLRDFGPLGLLGAIVISVAAGWVSRQRWANTPLVRRLARPAMAPRVPFGWPGAVVAGLSGCWVGAWLFGDFGPKVGGLPVFAATFGAINMHVVVAAIWERLRGWFGL